MESSGPSGKPAEPSPRWSDLLGTVIALITLTIPLLIIGYYSSQSPTDDFSPKVTSSILD